MSDETIVNVVVGTTVERSVTASRAGQLAVQVTAAQTVNSVTASTEKVTVRELGIVGPQGPAGPSGPAGTGTGGGPVAFPVSDVSSWYQTHSFGYLPEVRLVDDQNQEVGIGVEYPARDAVAITFPTPFTGIIYLN